MLKKIKKWLFTLFKRVRADNKFHVTYGMAVTDAEIYAPMFMHGSNVMVARADGFGRSVIKTVNNTRYEYKYEREVICRPSLQQELHLHSYDNKYREVIIVPILQ